MDKKKLGIAVSALWLLASIPLSQTLYDAILDGGFFMRVFAIALVAAPVWGFYGWQWLSDGKPVQRLYIGVVLAAGVALTVFFNENYEWRHVVYFPLMLSVAFAVLAVLAGGVASAKARPVPGPATKGEIHPDKLAMFKKLDEDIEPLRQITEAISGEIMQFMNVRRLRSSAPDIIHADTLSAKTAYGMVYGAFAAAMKTHGKPRHTALLAMYKSQFLPVVVKLTIPRIEGLPKLSDKELEAKAFRDPALKLMEIHEGLSHEANERIASNQSNPHYPLYKMLRPFVSPSATEAEMAAIFEENFAAMYRQANTDIRQKMFS